MRVIGGTIDDPGTISIWETANADGWRGKQQHRGRRGEDSYASGGFGGGGLGGIPMGSGGGGGLFKGGFGVIAFIVIALIFGADPGWRC